ncbi:hypothetical protein B0J11DRAFT_578518 [Dendryphion nanum]|uniref:Uncharacterized protein n=1 Tax=Dendryphion nanum TaxID=256645 RepID=A0A9P9E1I2_9PLEO|nr:hypothetical protein B0J11DRAFT_578518 [Dendryphion nanum]
MAKNLLPICDPSQLKHRGLLPTKFVSSPERLLRAVKDTPGDGNVHVEMRHNVYYISSDEEVDVKAIFLRCR